MERASRFWAAWRQLPHSETRDAQCDELLAHEFDAAIADACEPVVIPMLITCPACSERHVDEGAFATRPHHTHACQYCGTVWRPAIVATVGVRFLPGFKDESAPLREATQHPEPK